MIHAAATAVCWIGLGTFRVRWLFLRFRLVRLANGWIAVGCWLFRLANRISPAHPMVLRNLPWCLVEIGDAASAIEYYQRLVARSPSFVEGRLELGEALCSLDRRSEAIEHLERALVESPNDARVQRALAGALLAINHPADARPLCERLVEQNAGDAVAWGLLGEACARTSAWHNAIHAYERAHELGHDAIACQYAWALSELDRFEEAERVLRGAIASPAGDTELRALLAYVLSEQDRHSEAEHVLRGILEEDSANRLARGDLAVFLASRGRLGEAMAIVEVLTADAPEDAESLGALGWVALKAGRFQEALAAYDASLRLVPGWPYYVAGRATALFRLGRRTEAESAVRTVVARDPTFFDRHREWSEVNAIMPPAESR